MPIFLPGPGPLEQAPHAPAASAADAWAFVAQSRLVAAYRGSYSLNATAADQLAPPDTWASMVTQRATMFYRSPSAKTMSVFDPAANTFADWTPPPVQDRAIANYSPPRSRTVSPSFTSVLDTWAAATFGRATPYYQGSRPVTISVFDPAMNTFADWTPAALLSRSVQDYSPPRSTTLGEFGQSVITDQIAPLASSRAVAFYRAPAAFLARVYDQPFVASSTDFVASILSRQQANYRGSYSLIAGAADQAGPGVEFAPLAASRLTAYYRNPLGRAIPVYFAPGVTVSDPWAQVTQNRRVDAYRSPLSRLFASWDDHACTTLLPDTMLLPDDPLFPDLCTQVEIAFTTQGRVVAFYRAPVSQARNVYAPFTAAPDTWTTLTRSRVVAFYAAPRAFLTLVLDGPSGVLPGDPGGGGYGAIMSDEWFKRYDPRYAPRYAPSYKPTLRRQKKG